MEDEFTNQIQVQVILFWTDCMPSYCEVAVYSLFYEQAVCPISLEYSDHIPCWELRHLQ